MIFMSSILTNGGDDANDNVQQLIITFNILLFQFFFLVCLKCQWEGKYNGQRYGNQYVIDIWVLLTHWGMFGNTEIFQILLEKR